MFDITAPETHYNVMHRWWFGSLGAPCRRVGVGQAEGHPGLVHVEPDALTGESGLVGIGAGS